MRTAFHARVARGFPLPSFSHSPNRKPLNQDNVIGVVATVPLIVNEILGDSLNFLALNKLSEDFDVVVRAINNRNEKIARIKKLYEETVPRFNDRQFKYHFRVERNTVQELVRLLLNCPEVPNEFQQRRGRPPIPIMKQTLTTLWYLAITSYMI